MPRAVAARDNRTRICFMLDTRSSTVQTAHLNSPDVRSSGGLAGVAGKSPGLVRAEGRIAFLLNIPVKIRGRRTDDKHGISIIIIALRSLYGTMYSTLWVTSYREKFIAFNKLTISLTCRMGAAAVQQKSHFS